MTNDSIKEALSLYYNDQTESERIYGPVHTWNTSQVTSMEKLFRLKYAIPEGIKDWDVSSVTNMREMFYHYRSLKKMYISLIYTTTSCCTGTVPVDCNHSSTKGRKILDTVHSQIL